MFSLRKFVLGLVTTLALALPAAMPNATEAAAPNVGARMNCSHTRVYYVYFRTCPHSSWVCLGGYYQSSTAYQAANYVRYLGYDAFVR